MQNGHNLAKETENLNKNGFDTDEQVLVDFSVVLATFFARWEQVRIGVDLFRGHFCNKTCK